MTLNTNATSAELNSSEGHVVNESDYAKLYHETQEQLAQANAIIAASNSASSSAPGKSVQPKLTAQRLRATVGELGWLNMSRADRLMAIGCDPSISDDFLRKVFGRNSVGTVGRDLQRTDPSRHALLREAAHCTGMYAA